MIFSPTNIEKEMRQHHHATNLLHERMKTIRQKFLKCCQPTQWELSLPRCPSVLLSSTPAAFEAASSLRQNLTVQTQHHFTWLMHLFRLNQTLAKHLNLLSVLCEKSSMGLTCLAPGGGIGQECVELDSGKITLFSSIFSCSDCLSKWKWLPRESDSAHDLEQIARD